MHKKDTHVYNNCYELRSRAIKNFTTNISIKFLKISLQTNLLNIQNLSNELFGNLMKLTSAMMPYSRAKGTNSRPIRPQSDDRPMPEFLTGVGNNSLLQMYTTPKAPPKKNFPASVSHTTIKSATWSENLTLNCSVVVTIMQKPQIAPEKNLNFENAHSLFH